ncbi:MAG TPA: NmrA family NAD(P)-binding protein [Streptosporangiaceae bacterium]|nr:NmrA family NAD(P)-binding protein [Streptosporangiaceae bacterium]
MTGATGQVGYHLMEELADAGAEATAMVRVEAKAADLPGSPQHVVASLDDPPAAEVLRAFDRVFLLSPAHEGQVELETIFIDALVAAGHRPHVVKIAVDGFQDPDCDVRFMRTHRQIAVHLDATGLPVTYLAANLFMENLLETADTIRDQGTIFAPAGQGRIGFVAASDVARVAARILTDNDGGHEDQTYVPTGPEALSYADVAARVSAVFAREVDYDDLAEAQAKEQMQASGLSPWQVDGNLELFEWIRHGATDSVTSTVRDLTGDDPQTIEDWLSEMRAVFVGRPEDLPPSPV